jgi:hypothetical protein
MVVRTGLGPRIPTIVAKLQIGWQRNIGDTVLHQDLDTHLRRGLRQDITRGNADGCARKEH